MIKNLDKTINNLRQVKKAINNDVLYLFIDMSLDWIANRANQILDTRTKHKYGSDARSWTKKIYGTFGYLENNDMNSGAIEFGIGIEGLTGNLSSYGRDNYKDIDSKYAFDLPSQYKDDLGYWSFLDARTGEWLTINGYQGKSFLYDAFMEYKQNDIWKQMYKKAFDQVMRSVIK